MQFVDGQVVALWMPNSDRRSGAAGVRVLLCRFLVFNFTGRGR